jgi:hypothetical protein
MFTVDALDRARENRLVKAPTQKEMAQLHSVARSLVSASSSVEFDQRSGYWLIDSSRRRCIGLSYQQALYELTDLE